MQPVWVKELAFQCDMLRELECINQIISDVLCVVKVHTTLGLIVNTA